MRLAIVLVHYRAAGLAARAVDAFAADLAAAGVEREILIVDNGSDASDREILRELAERPGVRLLDPGANLGYAGGVNRGVAATTAEALVILNPDVFVRPGLTAALLAELATGTGVAGPRFFWDEERRFLLPPGDTTTRRDALFEILAARSAGAARHARRRWRCHARRHWEARGTIPSHHLSGALLAFRRDAWERVGPFDESYPLYFEETDWLRRAAAAGVRSAHVPAAEAIHLHDQSAAGEPRAAEWFAVSARRFRERYHGRFFTRGLGALARGWPARSTEEPAMKLPLALPPGLGAGAWLELSPNPSGYPAAAERLDGLTEGSSWQLPPNLVARLASRKPWRCVLTDARGVEHAAGWLSL